MGAHGQKPVPHLTHPLRPRPPPGVCRTVLHPKSLSARVPCRSPRWHLASVVARRLLPRLVALLHSSLASLVARRSSFGFLAASSSRYEGARSSPYSLLVFCLSRCSSLGLTVTHRSVARLGRLRRRSSVVRLSLGPRLACLVRRPSLLARRSSLVARRWSRCFSARAAARIFSPLALALRRTAAFQMKPFPLPTEPFRFPPIKGTTPYRRKSAIQRGRYATDAQSLLCTVANSLASSASCCPSLPKTLNG